MESNIITGNRQWKSYGDLWELVTHGGVYCLHSTSWNGTTAWWFATFSDAIYTPYYTDNRVLQINFYGQIGYWLGATGINCIELYKLDSSGYFVATI